MYEILWTGGESGLLISISEKLSWFHLTCLTLVLLIWKWTGLFLRKNHLLRCLGWLSLLKMIESLRPLAFKSSFSISCRILDFVGNIATFCLDIKQEFFIFHFSKFEFYNLKSYWTLIYSRLPESNGTSERLKQYFIV